jgi:Holliday junction resolvase RusA-like endonuclease
MKFVIMGVKPMGAVRMTRRGLYKSKTAQRYLDYKTYLQHSMAIQMKRKEPLNNPLHVNIKFFMPIPDSKKKGKIKTKEGNFHVSKPDIDNIVKGVFDAANSVVWKDDNLVVSVKASKIYSDEQGIELEVYEL